MIRFLASLLLVAFVAALPGPARAHPHVFTEARAEMVVDAEGRLAGVRHVWTFDEVFSTFARQGLDTNGDGVFSSEELAPLAEVNVESLAEFGYFTFVLRNDAQLPVVRPTDQRLTNDPATNQLTLTFTLPLETPVPARADGLLVKIYDPEFFVAFEFPDENPVSLAAGAPPACRFEFRPGRELDAMSAAEMARIPATTRNLPPALRGVTAVLANDVAVDCTGRTGPLLASALPPLIAQGTPGLGGRQLNLSELPPFPEDGAPVARAPEASAPALPPPPAPAATPGYFAQFLAGVARMQAELYRMFASHVRAVATDPWALFALLGLSFMYGVFHAAGPGHGKLVISSYLLANGETLTRGVVLSFASALVQGVVAIAIVGTLAIVLQTTSAVITRTAGFIEVASYALVVLVGAWLVWKRSRVFFAARAPMPLSAAVAAHAHGADCDHSHGIGAEAAANVRDLKTAVAAVLAAGIRPCMGGILLLVFALSQGVLIAGILGVLAMAVGTGLTIAVLATLAVGAKEIAVRLARRRSTGAIVLTQTIELTAAIVVFGIGVIFLSAALIYGPFGG